MSKKHFPAGWDEARVQRLIDHYEKLSDEEMIAEDEAAHKAGKNQLPVPTATTKVNGKVVVRGTRQPKKKEKKPNTLRGSKRGKGKRATRSFRQVGTRRASSS